VNLVLFEPGETDRPFAAADPRVRHILEVLKRRPGESFDAAVVDQARGKAHLRTAGEDGSIWIEFSASEPAPPPEPGVLLCGLCRPQTVRRIIRDCATLGIGAMHFFPAGRSEPSYAEATLWKDGEIGRLLREAAQQAFTPRLAEVWLHASLAEALACAAGPAEAQRLALDNYEADRRLADALAGSEAFTLAVGPERGWDATDRARLRAAGFHLCSLGSRVLRTEIACVGALTLARAALRRL
jgi:16S rRNA (uracil1498-N3)-methyltransferase